MINQQFVLTFKKCEIGIFLKMDRYKWYTSEQNEHFSHLEYGSWS